MKTTLKTICALIAAAFSLTAFAAAVPSNQSKPAAPGPDREELERAEMFAAMMNGFKDNLDNLETDIRGTVVDEDGKPLEDVRMEVRFEKPEFPFMTKSEHKVENSKVSGKFEIRKKGYSNVEIKFHKEDYYFEEFRFHGGFGMIEDEENTLKQPDLRVVMQKRTPRADLGEAGDRLVYDVAKQTRNYCDLSNPLGSGEKNGVRMVSIPLDEKPRAYKYLELDFLRDENGEIVTREFPGVVNQKGESPKYPAVFIFRFHSDDPDDGMCIMEDGGYLKDHPFDGKPLDSRTYQKLEKEESKILSGQTAKLRARPLERRSEAPKDGYTLREVSIPVEEMLQIIGSDGKQFSVHWRGGYRWMYIRSGNHYGKFSVTSDLRGVTSGVDYGALNEKYRCTFHFELYMNRKPGDTNLRY